MPRRPFDGPVVISQEYGYNNPFYRKGYHTGVDYELNLGHLLVSPTHGRVLDKGYEANTTSGRGHYIVIMGSDGVSHHLYHLRYAPTLAIGQSVGEGTPIGYVGSTGASTGPHLHWETRRGVEDFAPGIWLFADRPVYVPQPSAEYVRIFGDFRTLYNAPGGSRRGVLAPNIWLGGYLDYQVLERSGAYVLIQTTVFGKGWIYCGAGVEHLTQFYRK